MSQAKILVIRGGALGDFILTLPVLAALKKNFPGTSLELLGYRHIAELAIAGKLAEKVRSIEAQPLARFFARNGTLDPEWAAYFEQFSLVISYLYDPDKIFQNNVARCTRAQWIQGPHRPDETAAIAASESFLRPLERLAIFNADPVPRLAVSPSPLGGGRWLALHPGSGSERKNWPEGHWDAFLQALIQQTNFGILMIGGEAERQRLPRLSAGIPAERLRVALSLPLSELAGLLSPCRGFVGHDSGITHLAAAVGLPGFALWGDSNPVIWRPPNTRLELLRDPAGLAAIRPEKVLQRVQEEFA